MEEISDEDEDGYEESWESGSNDDDELFEKKPSVQFIGDEDEEDLEEAIDKFKLRTANKPVNLDFEAIKKMLVNPVEREYKTRFSVKIGHQIKVIQIEEIECFFSENKGTYIHTNDNRDYLLDITMEQLENEINPKDYFRINRKFIVPLNSIKEIQMHTNSRLKIILPSYKSDEVIVAREKVNDFKNWIG